MKTVVYLALVEPLFWFLEERIRERMKEIL
jgi:hypothetical protein